MGARYRGNRGARVARRLRIVRAAEGSKHLAIRRGAVRAVRSRAGRVLGNGKVGRFTIDVAGMSSKPRDTREASTALFRRAVDAMEASEKTIARARDLRRQLHEPTACPFCKSGNVQSCPNPKVNVPLYRCEGCRKAFYPAGVPTILGASRPPSMKPLQDNEDTHGGAD